MPFSLDTIYELALQRLDAQIAHLRRVEDKVRFVLGAGSIVMAAGAGFLSARGAPLPGLSWVFTIASIFVYLAIVLLSVKAYSYLELSYPPRIVSVWEQALFWDPNLTKRQILSQVVDAIESTREPLAGKVKDSVWQLYLLPLLVGLIILTVVVAI